MITSTLISLALLVLAVAEIAFLLVNIRMDRARNRQLEADNYRLIRRLGQYHVLPLGPAPVAHADAPPWSEPESIPPAFRTKKPLPLNPAEIRARQITKKG